MKKIFLFSILAAAGLFTGCNEDDDPVLAADFSSDKQSAVSGEVVNFKDQSTGNPTRWNWTFEGGTPATSELFSPEVTYSEPGTYSVKLVVGRGDKTAELTKESYITISYPDQVVADFTSDVTVATTLDVVNFTDESAGFPNSWKWEFIPETGTTVTSEEKNPSIKFDEGIYTVKLTVSNPNDTDSKTVENYLTVIDSFMVSADFTAESSRTYAGGQVTFADASIGTATAWAWEFEGGSPATSTEASPTVTYPAAGRYKVSMTASNEAGGTSTKVKEGYVIVIPADDIVLYYPLDGAAVDAGPNGIDPIVRNVGDGTLTFVDDSRTEGGKSAYLVDYTDGFSGGFLSVPNNSFIDGSGPYSVAFWAKTSNDSSVQFVFQQGHGVGYSSYSQTWFRFDTNSNYYTRFVVELTGSSGNWTDYKGGTMADGQWHHYVCTRSEGDTYVYCDGEFMSESLGKAYKVVENAPYTIGATHYYVSADGTWTYQQYLNGNLSDFVHYKRALTQQEAKELYELTK